VRGGLEESGVGGAVAGVSGFSGGFRTRCEGLIRRVFKIFLLLNEQLAVNRDLCRELSHLGRWRNSEALVPRHQNASSKAPSTTPQHRP